MLMQWEVMHIHALLMVQKGLRCDDKSIYWAMLVFWRVVAWRGIQVMRPYHNMVSLKAPMKVRVPEVLCYVV